MDRRVSALLVTREALEAFTQRLVEHFAPEQIILFGSQARGDALRDSDADILVVMPFEGTSFERRLEMLEVGQPSFPVDLLLCRPESAKQRYSWGDPFIRDAFDHGEVLHG
jgi:predicted nucleotidyltransferase